MRERVAKTATDFRTFEAEEKVSESNGSVNVTFSGDFLGLADEAAKRAEQSGREFTDNKGTIFRLSNNAAEAVVLSAIAAEASINETIDWIDSGFERIEKTGILSDDFLDLELRLKWWLLPRILVGTSFDRSGSPWQDFSALVKLRNALVHYKWQQGWPRFMRDFETRGLAFQKEGMTWIESVLTDKTARWAVNTVRAMSAKLNELAPPPHGATHRPGSLNW